MRNLIDLFEDETLKKQVISAVKTTDDSEVLAKVLKTLRAGNIEDRIRKTIGQDADASRFINEIGKAIIEIDAPIEEKDDFLKRYPGGIIKTGKLLNGNQSTLTQLTGPGFSLALFIDLCARLTSQGVGPGEVALAVYSPDISWSGRKAGGGDIEVGGKGIEVKTRLSKGGRWINARKAKMQVNVIPELIQAALDVAREAGSQFEPIALPDRLNPNFWVDVIRPILSTSPKSLSALTQKIAEATFNQTNNKKYADALAKGNAATIIEAILDVGYANYKEYSGFDGLLLVDMPSQISQYFRTYEDMKGHIKASTAYIYAPESEMMPQVILLPEGGGSIEPGTPGAAVKSTAKPKKAAKAVDKKIADIGAGRSTAGLVNPKRQQRGIKPSTAIANRKRR